MIELEPLGNTPLEDGHTESPQVEFARTCFPHMPTIPFHSTCVISTPRVRTCLLCFELSLQLSPAHLLS